MAIEGQAQVTSGTEGEPGSYPLNIPSIPCTVHIGLASPLVICSVCHVRMERAIALNKARRQQGGGTWASSPTVMLTGAQWSNL